MGTVPRGDSPRLLATGGDPLSRLSRFDLRRELDSGRVIQLEDARSRFAQILNEEEGFA